MSLRLLGFALFFSGAFRAPHRDVEFVEGGDEHGGGGEAVGEGDHEEGFQQVIDQKQAA